MTMLDLQAQFQPTRDIIGVRTVSPAVRSTKTVAKESSFNSILDKASQAVRQKQQLTSQNNPSSQVKSAQINDSQPVPEVKAEEKDAAAQVKPEQESQPVKQTNEQKDDQPTDQNLSAETAEETETADKGESKKDEASEKDDQGDSETSTDLVMGLTQAVPVTIHEPAEDGNNSQVSAVTADNTAEKPIALLNAEPAAVIPTNESEPSSVTDPETGQPQTQVLDFKTAMQSAAIKAGTESNIKVATEAPSNQSTATQEPEKGAEKNNVPLSGQEKLMSTVNMDLQPQEPPVNNQADTAGNGVQTAEKVDSSVQLKASAANQKNPVIELVSGTLNQAINNLAALKLTGQQSQPAESKGKAEEDQPDQGSNVASSDLNQAKNQVMAEDMLMKAVEKLTDNSSKPASESTAEVKKISGEEIQRLRQDKNGPEADALADPLISKTQPEVLPIGTGMEKAVLSLDKTAADIPVANADTSGPTVDPQDIIDQIVKKVELVNKAANSEMKIHLKPEFLGKIMIKVAVDNGVVTAHFLTESQQVKHLLETNLGSLKQNLESQGLKVDRTEVNVQLDNGGAFHGNDSGRQQMWQEYAERNSSSRLPYQSAEDYGDNPAANFQPYSETDSVNQAVRMGDGRVDFMI